MRVGMQDAEKDFKLADAGRLGGQLLQGPWYNVGTPDQLAQVNQAWAAHAGQPTP